MRIALDSGRVCDATAAAEATFRRPRQELLGLTLAELLDEPAWRAFEAWRAGGEPGLRIAAGAQPCCALSRDAGLTATSTIDLARSDDGLTCTCTVACDDTMPPDIELRRLNWALEAYARSSRALVRAHSLEEMAARVCEAIAERDGYVIAAIAKSEPPPGRKVSFIAQAGTGTAYLDGLDLSWDVGVAEGNGPAGNAIRTGEPVVVADALADPVFALWRTRAIRGGIRSLAAVPFGHDGERAFGAVAVFSASPDAFSPREVDVFQTLGDELLFAVGILADQQRLADARSAQAAAEAQARQRQTEMARIARVLTVGEFAASITHEITQPLAATVTNIEVALRYLAPGRDKLDSARAALERALRDAERASGVIRETRKFLAREQGDFAPCDLNAVVKAVLGFSDSDLQAAGIVVHRALDEHLPAIRASGVQLEQVLLNLVVNAREALQECGGREKRIVIRTWREGNDHVALSVVDNGPGMSEQAREQVFEHFYTTKPTGMGMGLAISRSIIEAHDGKMWCEAAAGGGTLFRIELPVETAEAEAA